MGRVNTPILNTEAKNALEQGFKTGKTHAFRVRCQLVLLKSENRKSKDVAKIVKMCEMSVNNWLVRYADEGIEGLKTKKGRGRKPLITKVTDEASVLESIKANRQRLQTAKAEWEVQSGKSVSRDTLRRFLKVLADDINE
jgi:transposase